MYIGVTMNFPKINLKITEFVIIFILRQLDLILHWLEDKTILNKLNDISLYGEYRYKLCDFVWRKTIDIF